MATGAKVKTNRKYKDTVFRDLFGSEERKENALSLYNALNGTHYDNPDELELTTLDDVLYMGLRNDVSLLVGDDLSLWEHQSTRNPNMPLRGLKYFARLYAAHVEKNRLNEYGTRLLPLPTPRFVVFYVGGKGEPAAEALRLSDAYEGEGAIEVTATVINVCSSQSGGLLSECEPLAGYVRLVELVRANRSRGLPFDEAIGSAIQQCIDEGMLADYLAWRRSNVIDMFMDEYDEEKIGALFREDGRQEGREQALAELVRDGVLDVKGAATRAGISEEEIAKLVAELA